MENENFKNIRKETIDMYQMFNKIEEAAKKNYPMACHTYNSQKIFQNGHA
jgi:hypothetical protein